MDGVERRGRWRNLKERWRFKGLGCCGANWDFGASSMSLREEDEGQHHHEEEELMVVGQIPAENSLDPACVGHIPAVSGMNLATALAAERHFRAVQDSGGTASPANAETGGTGITAIPGTPLRVSLMRLLEEADGGDGETEKDKGQGSDGVCCVCMVRRKGAAIIPCGHTFCRVCSRELWLNRGSCPLCNRSIIEILDIF